MVFIEMKLFTKLLPNYLDDENYSKLQDFLIEQPEAGKIIQGTNGLRKIRWAFGGKGKTGGVRIIYY
jgi:mRNA-degrading endonuclease RelE of RelBE toxin-antitoxin system